MKYILVSILLSISVSAFEPKTFFNKYCNSCHDEDVSKADFRTDELIAKMDFNGSFIKWEHTLMHLVDRSMPPKKKKKRPQHEEYEAAITWLRSKLIQAEMVRAEKKPKWMRRLNKKEYNNTIRDLFGIEIDISATFPMDDAIHGFDNVAEGLMISPIHIENYIKAANKILDEVIQTGPKPKEKSLRYDFRFYEFKKESNRADGSLSLRDGNSFVQMKDKTKMWVGGPFHVNFKANKSGYYKFTLKGIPRNWQGETMGAITMVQNKDIRAYDIKPNNGKFATLIEFESWVTESKKYKKMEVNWLNGHRLNTDGNFRELQKFKKMKPFVKWPDGLNWPYIDRVEINVSGPHYREWPNKLSSLVMKAEKNKNCQELFAEYLPLIFRRPVENGEINYYKSIVNQSVKSGENYVDAVKQALVTALVSPNFLFMMESPPPSMRKGAYQVNNFELASRLSYFIWSSMPDKELFNLARQGKLQNPSILHKQVLRMLKDSKAKALSNNFANQWLGTHHIPNAMPEPAVFKEFGRTHGHGENLKSAMAAEPAEFFDVIRREDLDIGNFIDSNFVVINNEIASHYGYKDFQGITFKKVPSQNGIRGGLITQAGILTVTSEATRTSPVKRGIWILETLFNRPPPPPPPNVEPLEEKEENGLHSMFQKLEAHRDNKACASCHMKIDPLGLALESFDGIGKLRDKEKVVPPSQMYLPHWKQKPVFFEFPESTELEDGSKVKSIKEFKQHLMSRKDDFVRGFAEKMMIYALGRELLVSDQMAIDKIISAVKKENYKFSSVVKNVVLSNSFKSR